MYLYENTNNQERYVVDFFAGIHTGGETADYKIEWLEDGVQIILSGVESHYYILPLKHWRIQKGIRKALRVHSCVS